MASGEQQATGSIGIPAPTHPHRRVPQSQTAFALALTLALAVLLLVAVARAGEDDPGSVVQGPSSTIDGASPGTADGGWAEASATLIIERQPLAPHYVRAEGFETDADGRLRVIVLLEGDAVPLPDSLEPAIEIRRRFTRLIHGLAARVEPAALDALRAVPGVRALVPDAQVQASLATSVPLVGAPEVWALHDGLGRPVIGLDVRVAVIDSGVDYTHPALGRCLGAGCKVVGGYDYVHDDPDPMDDHGHGTHVTGIVAADGLLQGVARGAEILAYKVLNERGIGYASDVIAAMEQALVDGAAVMNLSLGASGTASDPLSRAAQAAAEAGCVVAAAAGNRGPGAGTVDSPAIAPGVLAVAATDKQDQIAGFSARGPAAGTYAFKPDLSAPGVAITSTVPLTGVLSSPSRWRAASGTSMAAPHVAGGAALLRQLHPDWSGQEVSASLQNYAHGLGVDLFAQGAGRLDLLPAATADLLAVPPVLSFGLPLLDGPHFLTFTIHNVSTATQSVAILLDLAQVADGAGVPLSPTLPVDYGVVAPDLVVLAPGATGFITATLALPQAAADGYYQGWVHLQGSESELHVPVAFTLLSRVSLHVLDEAGQEIRGWGHMAVLARVPAGDVVIRNVPLSLPATFTVPSGDYHAQAFGRVGLYDHLLIPGLRPQVPYALIEPVTIAPHTVQTITLSVAESRVYWLKATDVDGNPAFLNAWAESFRYGLGGAGWQTRLGQSYVRVLSTDLPEEWPAGFPLRLSDTPEGVSFSLSLQGAGFSPDYRVFVTRHGLLWPADGRGNKGFPIIGSADRVEYLAWEPVVLDASTPPTFTLGAGDVTRYAQRVDLPGALPAPWLGWEPAGEGWIYPPNGASSALEPIAPGLTRTLTVAGPHHAVLWAGEPGGYRLFQRALYVPDWAHTKAWDGDPDVLFPDGEALRPLPAGTGTFTMGQGPLYPALSFDNQPGTVQMRHPILAGATGSPVVWGADDPMYLLSRQGMAIARGILPEVRWMPAPLRRWADLPPGEYTLTVTPSLSLLPDASESDIGPAVVRAGFVLTDAAGADMNPPLVLALELPQRYEAGRALTATWTLADAGQVALCAQVRLGDGSWQPLTVEPAGDGTLRARIEPAAAPSVSLWYTATDEAGNWIAWAPPTGAAAVVQTPVTLTFTLEPARVRWSRRPVTVRIRGTLLGPGGRPLSTGPAWLRLRAGGRFMGYVRDLVPGAGQAGERQAGESGSREQANLFGQYHTGEIDFTWSFVPADLATDPGPLPVQLEFDMGVYASEACTQTLEIEPSVYLPLVMRGAAK